MKISEKILEKYENFKYFKTMDNTQLAERYNCTYENIRQLRFRYVPETDSYLLFKRKIRNKTKQKIIDYIVKNNNNICINKCKKELSLVCISREYVQSIADEINIQITFNRSTYSHGVFAYMHKKHRCNICRLAICIKKYFQRREIKIQSKHIDYYANTKISNYEKVSPNKNRKFYDSILEDWNHKIKNNILF